MRFKPIVQKFYASDTISVAQALLGKCLVRIFSDREPLVGRIVETEAYTQDDPACHAYKNFLRKQAGKEIVGRSRPLFGPPGVAYVYLNYGVHWLFNVVTEKEGTAGAVLIRALEPWESSQSEVDLATRKDFQRRMSNGPGRLTKIFSIDHTFNGHKLWEYSPLFLAHPEVSMRPVIQGVRHRIGISKGMDKLWCFFDSSSTYFSQRSPQLNRSKPHNEV